MIFPISKVIIIHPKNLSGLRLPHSTAPSTFTAHHRMHRAESGRGKHLHYRTSAKMVVDCTKFCSRSTRGSLGTTDVLNIREETLLDLSLHRKQGKSPWNLSNSSSTRGRRRGRHYLYPDCWYDHLEASANFSASILFGFAELMLLCDRFVKGLLSLHAMVVLILSIYKTSSRRPAENDSIALKYPGLSHLGPRPDCL